VTREPRATGDSDPERVAEAVRRIQHALQQLAAAPATLSFHERVSLLISAEAELDFLDATARALRDSVRVATLAIAPGPTGLADDEPLADITQANIDARARDIYTKLRGVVDGEVQQNAPAQAGRPPRIQLEILAALVAATCLHDVLFREVPDHIANMGIALGFQLSEHLSDERVEVRND